MASRAFARRLYRELVDDAVTDSAAQLSYYLLFALFPFLFFLTMLVAYLPVDEAVPELMSRARAVLPASALGIIEAQLQKLLSEPRPKLLGLGAVMTLWGASRGVDAVRKALNLAYDVTERRPFWKTQLIAVGVTVLGALILLVSFSFLLLGGDLGRWLAERLGVASYWVALWSWLRWPLTAAVIMLLAALGYYVLPDVRQRFKYITPGSVIGTVTWLGASAAFGWYVERYGTYDVRYGSLGSVIVLLTWMYLSTVIYLIGGEINAILEFADDEGKAVGARAEGHAPEPPEVRPSAAPVGAASSAGAADRLEEKKLRRSLLPWRRRHAT